MSEAVAERPPSNWEAIEKLKQDKKFLEKEVVPLLSNEEAIARIEEEKRRQEGNFFKITATAFLTGTFLHGVGFAVLYTAYYPLVAITKAGRVLKVMEELMARFKDQGITIYPLIEVGEGYEPIDLYIRFENPQAQALVSIRSNGKQQVVYNEKNQELCLRRGQGRLTKWKPSPLLELAAYEKWLKTNRQRFGLSSNQIKKVPGVKLLAIWPPTRVKSHQPGLYREVAELPFLAISVPQTVFVIDIESIGDFFQVFLKQLNKKE